MSYVPERPCLSRNLEFRALCVVYVACLLVGQLIKPRIGSVPLSAIDLVIVGMLPLVALRMRARPFVFVAIAVFLAPNIFFGLMHQANGTIDSMRVLMGWYSCYRFLFPCLLIFCYARRIGVTDRTFCLRVLTAGLGFHILFGIFQSMAIPNFALTYGPDDLPWDYQENRLVSTFLDPNLVSSLFSAAILAILCHLSAVRPARVPLSTTLVVLGSAVAAALTASRGGAVGFVLVYALVLLENRELSIGARVKWILVSVLCAAFAAAVFVQFFGMEFIERTDRLGASNSSVGARLINILLLTNVFLDSPIVGRGFNFLTYLSDVSFVMTSGNYADGGILYLLASAGVVGVFSIGVILFGALKYFRSPRVLLYPAILLIVQSVTTASMYYPLLTIFVVLYALGLDGQFVRRADGKKV